MDRNSVPINLNSPSSPDSLTQVPLSGAYYHKPRRTRVPLSCHECTRRKIRCDKKIPCLPCMERGQGSSCQRRKDVSGRGRPAQTTARPNLSPNVDVEAELVALRARLTRVEAELSRQRGNGESYSEDEGEAVVDFEENGLAGALEEAALGIGENMRRQGASLDVHDAFPPQSQNDYRWFLSLPFSECLSRLPTRSQSLVLVQFYFEYLNWMSSCLHEPTFLIEHDNFWTLYEERRPQDGTSVALIFAVLSVAGFFLDQDRADEGGFDMSELQQLARLWFDCSLATFFRCQGFIKPSITACQTILTLSYSFHLSGNTAAHVSLSNLVLGHARSLNLHLLGSEKLGSNEEILRREIGRRIWWLIVDVEWFLLPYHRFTSVLPCQFDTALPDLTDNGTFASSTNSTHSLSFLLACCRSSRLLFDLYGPLEQRHSPSYEAVLKASAKMEQIVEQLPPELQPFRDIQQGGEPDSRAGLQYQRRFLGMLLAYRTYLMHRAYFAKSLRGQTYTESRTACVRAAGTILTLSDNGLPSTFYRLWSVTLWLVSAGIILSLDLIYAASDRKILPDAAVRRRRLRGVIDLLETLGDRSGIGARGAKLMAHLCTIERDISTGRMSAVKFTPQDIDTFVRNDPHEIVPDSSQVPSAPPEDVGQAAATYQKLPMEALASGAFDDSIFLPSAWGDFNQLEASGPGGEGIEFFGRNGQGNELFDLFDDWILQSSGV